MFLFLSQSQINHKTALVAQLTVLSQTEQNMTAANENPTVTTSVKSRWQYSS